MKVLVVTFLILFISCKSLQNKSNVGKIGNSDYYILKFKPNESYPLFENVMPTGLTHEEILDTEEIINSKVEETIEEWRNDTGNKYSENLYQYDRQYVAALNDSNEKLIWIIFFCDETTAEFYNLNKERTNISDGGKCYFELKVNLTDKEIIGYKFNGLG